MTNHPLYTFFITETAKKQIQRKFIKVHIQEYQFTTKTNIQKTSTYDAINYNTAVQQ
jgi:hypothetical protein